MVVCPSDYRSCEMPLKYQWKDRADRQVHWSVETLQEAVKRIKAEEMGKRAIKQYYGVSASTVYCWIASATEA
jgi:quinol monooxygenase YgiN